MYAVIFILIFVKMNIQDLISCNQKHSFVRYSLSEKVSQKLSWRVLGNSLHARIPRQFIRILIMKKITWGITDYFFNKYIFGREGHLKIFQEGGGGGGGGRDN